MTQFKHHRYFNLLILLFFLSQSLYASHPCEVRDGVNHHLLLKSPAKRIISLAPNLTEILFSVGAGSQIVGVIEGCDYPIAARKIRRIGSFNRGLDLKKITTLHPDLIVTWGDIFPKELKALRKLNIPIYTTHPQQLEDIPVMMKNLGCLAGTREKALFQAENFSYELEKIRKRYETQEPLTVFFKTSAYSFITLNKHSWINQVISVCGGRNVLDTSASSKAAEINWESIEMANPEVIISDMPFASLKKRFRTWNDISAVKNNRVFEMDPDLIERAGPRILQGTEKICKLLQTARQEMRKALPILV